MALYQTCVRRICSISSSSSSSYKGKNNFFYLLTSFPKQAYYSLSAFIWRNFCYSCINHINISKPNFVKKRNISTFTVKSHNSFPTNKYRLLHPFRLPKQIQQQQLRLYSSVENGDKENTVPETFIGMPYTVQEEVDSTMYRKIMRNVPQPIVLLTSAKFQAESNTWLKRGVTCNSLLSVSLKPPILSFCLNRPSRMHDLLLQTQQLAINILGKHQAKFVDVFSSPARDGLDQFSGIPHQLSKKGLPILIDTPALLCRTHCVHNVGDHSVWYGIVVATLNENKMIEPVLHYFGSYHEIGEKIPILPRCVFTQGPVFSHIQVAWQCVKSHGQEGSLQCMKETFQKQFQLKEKDWHETIAMFYLNKVSIALNLETHSEETFEEFLQRNNTLTNLNEYLLQYYTIKLISSPEAKEKYVPPDKKPFNNLN